MIRFRKSALLAIPAVIAATAVVVSVLPASSATTGLAPAMSAVELANGLLYNQGPAARYLTALNRPAFPLKGKTLAVERSVDRALRSDPAVASAFARDVQSGNRVKVDVALASLGRLTKAAYDRAYGVAATRRLVQRVQRALENPAQMAPDDSSGGGGGAFAYATLAVAATTATVVVSVAFVVRYVALGPAAIPSGSPAGLAAERITNLVAISLHASR